MRCDRCVLFTPPSRTFAFLAAEILAAAAVAENAADPTPLHQASLCRKHLNFELLLFGAHVRFEGYFWSQFSLSWLWTLGR